MIVTLNGENSFVLRKELSKLTAEFVRGHGDIGLERLDGEEAPFRRLQEALTSLPFLSAKKLVVLNAPGKNKEFAEKVEQLLEGLAETTDVIIIEPKLDKRFGYYKFLKAKTDFREFHEPDQPTLTRWLTTAAQEGGGSLSLSDANYLIERVGLNQRLLANELEKLLLYDPHISRDSIMLLTDETPQSTVFQLLESAFAGKTVQALRLYQEQRALRVEPAQIIAMLTWQLHVIALLKTAGERTPEQIAREARLNPYVVRKTAPIVRRLSLPELKQLVADLLEIDVRLKREPIDADEALQNYLLRLSNA